MDRNVHADLPFSEDAFIDADITGAINVNIREVLYNTTEYWNTHPEIIATKGIIYIYSDYKTIDDKTIPGIKVGDGSSHLIDIPFSDIEVELKADKATTYTKTEVNSALSSKADKSTTYTKTEVDNALRNKADYSDMVGRFAEVDLKLYSKADKSSTYTKDEVNNALDLKADKSTTYTKTEVDNALSEKANTTDVNSALDTKADKSNTYTKTEVNNALDLKSDKSNTYTKAEVDNIISNLPDPMIFMGSVGINGTITDLPVASASNDGFTYKVITEGTYQGIDAKVGDVFTSNGTEWVLIPSGDDVEDTWREIKVNGITVLNSALSTGAVDFVEGDNIEVIFNSTGNTILIKTKNIYTKTEVNNALDLKSNKSDTYTKTEVNNSLDLKSDKSDTYTKTEVNNALSAKADTTGVNAALDLKADKSDTYTKTEVDNALSTKADTDGTYEDMTVGTAMKLVATRHTTDTAPYLFRQSGGDNNAYVGTSETDKLVGASAVVNQSVKNGNFVDTSNWTAINSSLSVANNEATVTVTDTSLASEIRTVVTNRKGHKYFRSAEVKASQGQFIFSWYGAVALIKNANGNYQTISDIFESPSNDSDNWRLQLGVKADNSPSEFFAKNIILIDLTAMFGTTIADYIYSLEQATAGSGIAYLRKYGFFTKDYYPYTANSLQSVNTSKHTMVGKNQFDLSTITRNGTLAWLNGRATIESGSYASDYIEVVAGATYRASKVLSQLFAYDKDKNYVYVYRAGVFVNPQVGSNVENAFTIPDGVKYIKIVRRKLLIGEATIDEDVADLQIEFGSATTAFEPYVKHEYALPNIDLRGLYKLDASNNLYADGDTLEGDSTLTRKWGLTTLNDCDIAHYEPSSSYPLGFFYCKTTPVKKVGTRNIVCPVFITTGGGWSSDNSIFGNATISNFYLICSSCSSVEQLKQNYGNQPILFELAEPTTEASTGFTNPQIVSKDGTEEYVDNRDMPLPVGHETDYPLDSEMALPVPPVAQGTYNLQLTVDASGNQTYSWGT